MTPSKPQCFASFALLLGIASIIGCGDDDHGVSIDVRTDFLPAAEFNLVRLTIDGTVERVAVDGTDDYLAGARVYDGELAPGDHEVVVALVQSGRSVVTRRVLFRVDTDRGMTVLLTRSCANVMCSAATTCVSGACVDPGCTPETLELCEAPECMVDTECPPGTCGAASCILGSCFRYDDGLCGAGAFCDPDFGCQGRETDAGPGPDAMVDATSDVGRDAFAIDTGDTGSVDGGNADGGPDADVRDAGPSDTGRDAPAPRDTGGPDVPGPTGDCRNAGDEGILEALTVQQGINIGNQCYQTHGNNAGLIQSCVEVQVGVSSMCSQCFVGIVQCTVANCASPCMSPFSMACTSCRMANCDAAFTACSGFNI